MALFAASLRDLGRACRRRARRRVRRASSMRRAARRWRWRRRSGGWRCFADRSRYEELELPFLKRAQIAAADLHRAGVARFGDLDRLTMFADNLVPHVLRLDGVLRFDPELVARIEREELIEHGSPEEVEIRACAVHAVELIVGAGAGPTAAELDQLLWQRGQQPALQGPPAPPHPLHGLLRRGPDRAWRSGGAIYSASPSAAAALRVLWAIASAPASPTSSSGRIVPLARQVERREAADAGQRLVERDHGRLAADRGRGGGDHRQRAAVDDVARRRQRLARQLAGCSRPACRSARPRRRRGPPADGPGRSTGSIAPFRASSEAAKLTAAAGGTGPAVHSEISSGRTPASTTDSVSSSRPASAAPAAAAPRSCPTGTRRRSSPGSPCRTASATRSPSASGRRSRA